MATPKMKQPTALSDRATQHRLTISAATVLIAAIGAGLGLVRPALKLLADSPITFGSAIEPAVFYGLLYTAPVAFTCSLAMLALSLRSPRPTGRQLARRPGFVVNAAGILGAFVTLLPYIGQIVVDSSQFPRIYMHVLSTGLPGDVGFFVLGALLPLVLRRQFCPCPTWEDRLSWLIGMLWILMSLLTYSRLFLYLIKW